MTTSGDDRSVKIGGSVSNAHIITGENNTVSHGGTVRPRSGGAAGTNAAETSVQRTGNILFADVKGFSGLSDAQKQIFMTVIVPLIRARIEGTGWRDPNTWGDGIVLVSDRIAELSETALHIRNVFADTNWARHGLPMLAIRISLHHGEFFETQNALTDRRDFGGRAIDEAARLEPVTPPGKIYMTEQAAAVLKSYMKSDASDYFAYDDIGEIDLPKNYGRIRVAELRRGNEQPATRS